MLWRVPIDAYELPPTDPAMMVLGVFFLFEDSGSLGFGRGNLVGVVGASPRLSSAKLLSLLDSSSLLAFDSSSSSDETLK